MFSDKAVPTVKRQLRTEMSARATVVLALGCIPLLLCTNSTAQQANNPKETPFTIQANVNRVLLQIVVRDKQGNIVDGLKEEDFRVFDNGKVHPVSHFMIERRLATYSDAPSNNKQSATAHCSEHRWAIVVHTSSLCCFSFR
jgi:hypothetical protein